LEKGVGRCLKLLDIVKKIGPLSEDSAVSKAGYRPASVLKKPLFPDKHWGTLANWI